MTVLLASPGSLDGGFPFGVSVVRLRAVRTPDPYSTIPAEDWGAPRSDIITHVAVAPTASVDVEGPSGRWVESTAVLYSRTFDLDVMPQDRIVYDGITYAVTGEGSRWEHPDTGRKAGAEFGLKALS